MNPLRPIFAALLLAVSYSFAQVNVFDLPGKHQRHIQLLMRMDAAHAQKGYGDMAAACREGLELNTAPELWAYNLACACALLGQTQEALTALDQAIASGFLDADFAGQDPDLAALRNLDGFRQRLDRMKSLGEKPAAQHPAVLALPPDASQTVMQTSSNTLWSFQTGLFQVFVATNATRALADYNGPEAAAIRAWQKEGTAAGCRDVIYANRDNNAHPLDLSRFPGVMRLGYADDAVERRLHIGLPNSFFSATNSSVLLPVIGQSSLGYLNSPYRRSQPRAVCGDPRQMALQSLFLVGNQLFFYPTFGDFDPAAGDLFPANTPYCFAVAGADNAEVPFVEAALAALAALRPETRDELARTGLLMPTLQMLFRASQRTVKSRADYLTGLAHPAAFQAENLDTAKLVAMAHALTTNDLPPLVILAVQRETQTVADRDYFDILRTEQQFDSPLAIARVFRGAARTRTLEIRTQCKREDAKLHWVVLQGDPGKVDFKPCPTNASLMTLTVAYHDPFRAALGNGKSIPTSRVDIGVIAETSAGFSVPSFISFYFLSNERRTYSADGRILGIDYTRPWGGYVDPLMSYTRNWKDAYQYDEKNNLIGWIRRRGLTSETFTAFGHRVVATDAQGRATLAHIVRYVPRRVNSEEPGASSLPDLAQTDDNVEIAYRYASDSDFVGAPDFSTVRQERLSLSSAPLVLPDDGQDENE
mgnify:CR=1 FL=1